MATLNEATGAGSSTAGEQVTISATELAELTSRASQSSQNFERLKLAQDDRDAAFARIAELEGSNNAPLGLDPQAEARIKGLETTLQSMTESQAMVQVLEAFPAIKGKEADFDAFRKDPANAGLSLATAAKGFVIEKGLSEIRRPGLEAPTGGAPAPVASGKMTPEEAEKLRMSNFKAYREALKRGDIQVA